MRRVEALCLVNTIGWLDFSVGRSDEIPATPDQCRRVEAHESHDQARKRAAEATPEEAALDAISIMSGQIVMAERKGFEPSIRF